MRMKLQRDPMARFYRNLLSSEWKERLRAYEVIEQDLRQQGSYMLTEDHWEDMKLLAGQIISIYFKRNVPEGLEQFKEMLKSLYDRLMSPLHMDKTPGYEASMQLLIGIYDDDDWAAQDEIRRFFQARGIGRGVQENEPVLKNLWACYVSMMQQVRERSQAL